jgi:hypothetical protein
MCISILSLAVVMSVALIALYLKRTLFFEYLGILHFSNEELITLISNSSP